MLCKCANFGGIALRESVGMRGLMERKFFRSAGFWSFSRSTFHAFMTHLQDKEGLHCHDILEAGR